MTVLYGSNHLYDRCTFAAAMWITPDIENIAMACINHVPGMNRQLCADSYDPAVKIVISGMIERF